VPETYTLDCREGQIVLVFGRREHKRDAEPKSQKRQSGGLAITAFAAS
jgi:hypothetical protein